MVRVPTPLDLGNKDLPRLCLVPAPAQAVLALALALGLCQCKLTPDHLRLRHSRNAMSCNDRIKGRHQARGSRRTVYPPPVGDSIHEWALRQAECLLWVRLQKPHSAMSHSDIFGLQGWTPGCKGPHLGILNIAVHHHQDRDKCQCRVSLISRSISRPHLWAPWALWDQDMECLPHSNHKGVESRSMYGDKRSPPGRDWKEHTRTRPLDPHLCAIIQSLVLFYWTLSACDGPRPVACLNDFYYLFLVPTSSLSLHVFETSTSLYGFDDLLRSFYRIFYLVVIELRTCTSGRAGPARTEIEMVLLAFRPSLARVQYAHGGKI